MGSDLMMQDIPPPPPGFTIVGGGGAPPPTAPARQAPAPRAQSRQYAGPLPTEPEAVFPALVAQESGGRAGVLGPQTRYGRAEGRTQMLPATAQEMAQRLGVPWRPEMMRGQSPEAAAYQDRLGLEYLRQGYEQTGNMRDALRYYHGGPDRDLWGPKTQAYSEEVLARLGQGGGALSSAAPQSAAAPPPPPPGFEIVASPLDDLNIHRPENVDMAAASALGDRGYTGPGSSETNPLEVTADTPRETLMGLTKGMWIKTPEGVRQLSGDAYVNANAGDSAAETRIGQNAVLREENLADQSRAFAMAAAEQVPFLDEAIKGAAGAISGRGYSDVSESWNAAEGIDNQVNRDQRVAGGIAGAAGMMVAPGVGQAGSFIRAGATPLAQTARAATVGGATGGLFGAASADGGLEERAVGGLLGAAVGAPTAGLLDAGGQRAIQGAANRFAAGPSPQRRLSRQGVDLTPGQAAGGILRRVEDGLTSVPILGDAIRGAQRRGLGTFDNVATNTAIEPIGVNLADTAGRAGVRSADDAISNAYTQALQGTNYAFDAPATAALTQVRRPDRITADMRRNLNAILDSTLEPLNAGPVTGQVWKEVDSQLASAIRAADRGSASAPEQRILRDRLQEAREAVGGAMERANPNAYAAVRNADRASAQYRLVRKASADVASAGRGGDASPATLNRAVVAAGGERQAARGESLLQDLTDDAMAVMPSTVPDSGTPFRGLLSLGALGGGAATVGADAGLLAMGIGGLGAASTLYGPTVQRAFNAIYRATDRQTADSALGELQRAAARNPALQSHYEAAARHVRETFGRPSQEPAPASTGLLSPTGR